MAFWKPPSLPKHPEGMLEIPASSPEAEAVRFFNEGNFAACWKALPEISSEEDSSRRVLEDLRARLRPEPAVLVLTAICIMLAIYVTLWAISVSH